MHMHTLLVLLKCLTTLYCQHTVITETSSGVLPPTLRGHQSFSGMPTTPVLTNSSGLRVQSASVARVPKQIPNNFGDSFFLHNLNSGDINTLHQFQRLHQTVDTPMTVLRNFFQFLNQTPSNRTDYHSLLQMMAVAGGLLPNTWALASSDVKTVFETDDTVKDLLQPSNQFRFLNTRENTHKRTINSATDNRHANRGLQSSNTRHHHDTHRRNIPTPVFGRFGFEETVSAAPNVHKAVEGISTTMSHFLSLASKVEMKLPAMVKRPDKNIPILAESNVSLSEDKRRSIVFQDTNQATKRDSLNATDIQYFPLYSFIVRRVGNFLNVKRVASEPILSRQFANEVIHNNSNLTLALKERSIPLSTMQNENRENNSLNSQDISMNSSMKPASHGKEENGTDYHGRMMSIIIDHHDNGDKDSEHVFSRILQDGFIAGSNNSQYSQSLVGTINAVANDRAAAILEHDQNLLDHTNGISKLQTHVTETVRNDTEHSHSIDVDSANLMHKCMQRSITSPQGNPDQAQLPLTSLVSHSTSSHKQTAANTTISTQFDGNENKMSYISDGDKINNNAVLPAALRNLIMSQHAVDRKKSVAQPFPMAQTVSVNVVKGNNMPAINTHMINATTAEVNPLDFINHPHNAENVPRATDRRVSSFNAMIALPIQLSNLNNDRKKTIAVVRPLQANNNLTFSNKIPSSKEPLFNVITNRSLIWHMNDPTNFQRNVGLNVRTIKTRQNPVSEFSQNRSLGLVRILQQFPQHFDTPKSSTARHVPISNHRNATSKENFVNLMPDSKDAPTSTSQFGRIMINDTENRNILGPNSSNSLTTTAMVFEGNWLPSIDNIQPSFHFDKGLQNAMANNIPSSRAVNHSLHALASNSSTFIQNVNSTIIQNSPRIATVLSRQRHNHVGAIIQPNFIDRSRKNRFNQQVGEEEWTQLSHSVRVDPRNTISGVRFLNANPNALARSSVFRPSQSPTSSQADLRNTMSDARFLNANPNAPTRSSVFRLLWSPTGDIQLMQGQIEKQANNFPSSGKVRSLGTGRHGPGERDVLATQVVPQLFRSDINQGWPEASEVPFSDPVHLVDNVTTTITRPQVLTLNANIFSQLNNRINVQSADVLTQLPDSPRSGMGIANNSITPGLTRRIFQLTGSPAVRMASTDPRNTISAVGFLNAKPPSHTQSQGFWFVRISRASLHLPTTLFANPGVMHSSSWNGRNAVSSAVQRESAAVMSEERQIGMDPRNTVAFVGFLPRL